jgi:myo-inositol-1(or 4)-monophosphatase
MDKKIKAVLNQCIREGGALIKKGYGKSHRIRKKAAVSLVTEIDMAVDKRLRAIISKNFPDHQIMTEEQKDFTSASPYRWIIDPLDGTTNFAHEIPVFCTSIGVEYRGEIILGGVYNPVIDEYFYAEKGGGAYLNGKRIHVSRTNKLIDSLLSTVSL